MDLTPDEQLLAALSKNFYERREEIEALMKRLLLDGERQIDVARVFGRSETLIEKKAREAGVPKVYGPHTFGALLNEVREAVLKELKPGEKFWSQAESRKRFRSSTRRIAQARDALVGEGLLETVIPHNDALGYKRTS